MPCLSGSHENHDACWCVVSANHQLPVCIACIIEQLEDHSLTMVQQQFNLTVLFGLMADNGEVSSLFHEHPPVCQLLLDIITEHYTDNSHMAVSVDICAHIIDDIQQEELYIYLLNRLEVKFQHDVETTPFILSLLVRLAAASSVYTLTLAHTHGPLLRNLLNIQATSVICDEDVQCSLSLLVTHLCDADVLPTVSTDVLPLIELCLLSWLTSAQSPSLQVNCSALLKRVLQSEGCLLEDQETWSPLFHGLKRMFVSKREVLQTCAAQCLAIIATSSRHSHHLQQALKSDLPGMEPVLHALGVSLETQNVAVLESGFSLLAFILERQLETVPLFANKNTEQLALCVIKKGLECHLIQVSLAASRAVAAFFSSRDSGQRDPSPFSVKQLAEIACARLTGPMARGESGHLLHILGIQDEQLMRVLLALLSGVSKSVRADEDLFDLIMNKCDEDVIPYFTWSASQLKDDIPEDISLQPGDICVKSNVANCWAVEQHIVSHICDLPVEMWATPSPVVFLWLFSNRLRALGPGRNLMEYWLLHTRGKLMGSGIDDTFVTLAHLVDFRRVLMDLMVLPSEEISVWTTDFVLHLLRSKDEETKFHAAQCLTMVIEYSLMFDSRLGEYLVHHPWNKTLVRCLLSPSSCAQFDLPPQTATLISKIWKTETTTDSETAKVILESLVLAEVTDENYEVLLTLLQQTKPVWRDTSLVQKVESRLSNFRNDSCSFSQNLLTPT
ncbi:hypothetical protein BaRGS_00024111 [Batillaria attramentaria]|uniref:Uncharacterized protein n=1 Tax=Batillaria attramentaria TaxID=370345 RepID=A0ABD0KC56_9CAEN